MLADPRARNGVATFFEDLYDLDKLEALAKDPAVFAYMADDFWASARAETLADIDDLVFAREAPYRELFTAERTWIDRRLAAIYHVQAPEMDGFGWVDLDPSGGRRGLLGHASFLALNAHSTSTSVTRRGLFVREVLLCQDIPAPPGNVSTVIPEVTADAPTMRERVAQHLEDPTCAACHQFTDPVGLGLENFDGLGSWRDLDGGTAIDASGELDGVAFSDGWELANVLSEHPRLASCFVRILYRYALGREPEDADEAPLAALAEGFIADDQRVLGLMRSIAISPVFRTVGDIE